ERLRPRQPPAGSEALGGEAVRRGHIFRSAPDGGGLVPPAEEVEGSGFEVEGGALAGAVAIRGGARPLGCCQGASAVAAGQGEAADGDMEEGGVVADGLGL